MIPAFMTAYNSDFTSTKYHEFLADLDSAHPGEIDFR
jgi:hypothetical protein